MARGIAGRFAFEAKVHGLRARVFSDVRYQTVVACGLCGRRRTMNAALVVVVGRPKCCGETMSEHPTPATSEAA